MPDLKVLIVGAGLGGLTLAQSLRGAGIAVQLFERDKSPWDRPQGYRLHLDADALNAVGEVLPPLLHALFEATAQRTEPFTTILDTGLAVVKRLPTADEHDERFWPGRHDMPTHANVDRATLRQILLTGLEDVLHFDRRMTSYASGEDGVVLHFDNGETVEGHVLVGADGIRSAVRAQRASHAETVDAGVQAIYGRVPIATGRALVPPETIEDIFTIASDERKVFLGLGSVNFPTPPDRAAATLAPDVKLAPRDDYIVCIVGGRHERFTQDRETLKTASSEVLQRVAADMLASWPERAAAVVQNGDPTSFFFVDMYTSVPCWLGAPNNVTLLGDAIHAMTPTLGRGANLAMRDGALLGRALKSVAAGEHKLSAALAAYEKDMLEYGFDVVRQAAKVGEQRMAQNPLPR